MSARGTFGDDHHKGHESHQRPILDINRRELLTSFHLNGPT